MNEGGKQNDLMVTFSGARLWRGGGVLPQINILPSKGLFLITNKAVGMFTVVIKSESSLPSV
jgi:hypothetical protein